MMWIFYALIEILVSIQTYLCASIMMCFYFSVFAASLSVIFEPTCRSSCWNALAVAPTTKYSTVTGESATYLYTVFYHPSIFGVFFFFMVLLRCFLTHPALSESSRSSLLPGRANMSGPFFPTFFRVHLLQDVALDPYQHSPQTLTHARHQHPPCMTRFQ